MGSEQWTRVGAVLECRPPAPDTYEIGQTIDESLTLVWRDGEKDLWASNEKTFGWHITRDDGQQAHELNPIPMLGILQAFAKYHDKDIDVIEQHYKSAVVLFYLTVEWL